MASAYRLMLVSPNKPDRPADITRSTQMIGWGLWHEFSKLPHVTLSYNDSRKPPRSTPVDFTLIHCCTGDYVLENMTEFRSLTSKKIMYIMEAMRKKELVDRNFCFLPRPASEKLGLAESEQIDFPYNSQLTSSTTKKIAGSILIDHPYPGMKEENQWTGRIAEWVYSRGNCRDVAQLVIPRHKMAPPPAWVKSIPETSYMNYLESTAMYENFIMTHPESFGHSITDMVVRGIRVIVPVVNGKPFAKSYIVDRLKLPTFSTREELAAILAEPPDAVDRRNLCTDMPEVVRRIDAYCSAL